MKKNLILFSILLGILFLLIGFSIFKNMENEKEIKMNQDRIILNINGQDFTVELENNQTTNELAKKLENGPVIIETSDYGNFEKVGSLGFRLPTNDERITTNLGDIVLYNGNEISLFYNSNTWEYTRIGHIVNINKDEFLKVLDKENVTLKFSLK